MSEKTIDVASILCVVLVELDDADAAACTEVLRPIRTVRAATIPEARDEIARRHPLVVVTRPRLSADERDALREVVFACGAEVVKLGGNVDRQELRRILLEALHAAERRRSSPR